MVCGDGIMRFTKMHGCGNDYIYINGFSEKIPQSQKPLLARAISRRHFGVGGDGVIFVNPSQQADFEMEMYNADGSRAEMCGNGIRCVAKYVYDAGMTDATRISVVSGGRRRELELTVEGASAGSGSGAARGVVTSVRVDMGSPELKPELIPVEAAGERCVNELLRTGDREYRITCVSMGNPHAVIFAEDVAGLELEKIGPALESHSRFPNRMNVEFVQVLDRETVFMRVWERGTGETLACGTGCCAAAVACVLNGLTEPALTVRVLGGGLFIEWDRARDRIYMTGPAETVFEGELALEHIGSV